MSTVVAVVVVVYLLIGAFIGFGVANEIKRDKETKFLVEGNPRGALIATIVCGLLIFGWLGMVLGVDGDETEGYE